MDEITLLRLNESEAAVLAAASRIYAGFLAAGKIEPGNEESLREEAVEVAIALAQLVDARVQSQDELM